MNGDGSPATVPLLSVQELADYLKVSVQTVYGWRKRGTGPQGVRVGGHVRYLMSDVMDWINEQRAG
jgi:excisionase family DNA binding protein